MHTGIDTVSATAATTTPAMVDPTTGTKCYEDTQQQRVGN
jgi:hypothetical protein